MNKFIDLKKEKRKKELKSVIFKITLFIIIIYILYAIYLLLKIKIDTVIVEKGTLTEEEVAIGYIIRDETVVKGDNYKNGMYQILSEGEKSAKKQTIFRYYSKSEEELQEKINEIDIKIQNALEKEKNTIFSVDIKSLDKQIYDKIKNLQNIRDLHIISEYKKELMALTLKKATIMGENSQSGSYIKKLIAEREKYEKKLSEGSEYITAPVSGIVSYRVDGFEEVLNTENFDDLDSKKLEELDIKTGKIVASSNEMGKVVDNFGCYIATILDSEIAKEEKEGNNVQITMSSDEDINAKIYYKKEQDDGRVLIIFKISALNEELMSYRKISMNITWWSYSGIKIPNNAIKTEKDNLKYVLKKTTNGNKKALVKVLKSNNDYSIIGNYSSDDIKSLGIESSKYDNINMYDTIIIGEQSGHE